MRNRRGWPARVTVGLVDAGLLVAALGPVPAVGATAGIRATLGATMSAVSVGGVEYEIIDLGSLGGKALWVADVNERGQVAGTAETASGEMHAFRWDPVTGMTDLGTLGGDDSGANAVNDRGQVVGWSYTRSSTRAFLWDPVTGMTNLGTLDGVSTSASAVNDRGQVGGDADGWPFLWDPVAGMTNLGGSEARVWAVNERGQVAGRDEDARGMNHAVLWDPVAGKLDLGTLGGHESGAWDVNEGGQVTGGADTASGEQHAFLWDPVTGMADLGTLEGNRSGADCVNERGQVVGGATTAFGAWHAFLWDPVMGMSDLGTLGGNESFADCVNDQGQVAGSADTAFGERHPFLWDPVAGMTDLGPRGAAVTGVPVGPNERGQVAGVSGGRAVLWTPVALAPHARVRAAQARYGDKLRVNVNPNRIGEAWKFRVQKRTAAVWTTLPTVYRTRGLAETRTLTLGPGWYRVKVANRYGYTGATSTAVRLTRKTARVHLGTDAARTRLRVNVDPNQGSGHWSFRVQRQRADSTWRTLPRTYATCGKRETRALNLNQGTYRVQVQEGYGYRGTTSTAVQLRS